ncbi:Hsp20/alpha crystallin family protein [Candidatus Palauibacter sp.]|uniref:Hsp20/alpha crystallin family protein n=1 Tax=Candidatus Palauibacter sp. TaxID=3101350 RepID=UPI003B5C91AF
MLPTINHRSPARRRGDFGFDRLFHGLLDSERSSRTVAAADLYETEEGYGLELELPGFTEVDMDVTVDCGVLTISGSRAEAEEEKGRTYHVRERRHDRFTRSFALPASIDGEGVVAHLDAGVLTVELPKSPEAKPHRISVGRAK